MIEAVYRKVFVVPSLTVWLLLAPIVCWQTQPAAAGGTSAQAQKSKRDVAQLPALPVIAFDSFGPVIREHIKKSHNEARENPENANAVGQFAMVLQTYEEYDLAAVVYERARGLSARDSASNVFQWLYLLATCQIALGKHDEAVKTLREALVVQARQKIADYLPARVKLADSLLARGALAESRKLYETIIAKQQNTAQAHYGLGRLKARSGETSSAIESLKEACNLSSTWGAAHYALALAYRDVGNPKKADEHLKLYEQNKLNRPSFPPPGDPLLTAVSELNAGPTERLRKAIELEAAGSLAESIAEHERALEIDPQLAQAHINLIQLYGRTHQPAKAEEHYRAVVALNPNLADGHYNFGVMMVDQKRWAEAAEAFRRAIDANPQLAEAHLNYGALLEQQQQFDEAARHYRLAVENKPDNRQTHFQLARMLIHKGELQEAIKHLLQTLRPPSGLDDDQTPRFTYALAAAYARAGDKANALKYAREARDKAAVLKQTELLALIERDLKVMEQEQ